MFFFLLLAHFYVLLFLIRFRARFCLVTLSLVLSLMFTKCKCWCVHFGCLKSRRGAFNVCRCSSIDVGRAGLSFLEWRAMLVESTQIQETHIAREPVEQMATAAWSRLSEKMYLPTTVCSSNGKAFRTLRSITEPNQTI